MTTYTITSLLFRETTDFTFRVSFSYSGVPLETPDMSRTATTDEIKGVIANTVDAYVGKRADTNYQSLKTQFDGKQTVTFTV